MIRLASGSPRRQQLLALLGAPFEVVPADVDERAAAHPAVAKARAVARAGVVTLGADTMIEIDGERLGKPAEPAAAVAMLRRLRGRPHVVRTQVALIGAAGRDLTFDVRSTVALKPVDDAAIEAYVASGEPLDKAGGYAIQGAGARLVARYDGCYSNIVGLPVCHTFFALRRLGVGVPERPEPAFTRAFGFECPAWRIAYAQGRSLRNAGDYETAVGGSTND